MTILMVRYCMLSYVLCIKRVSARLRRRFPSMQEVTLIIIDHHYHHINLIIINANLMTMQEVPLIIIGDHPHLIIINVDLITMPVVTLVMMMTTRPAQVEGSWERIRKWRANEKMERKW